MIEFILDHIEILLIIFMVIFLGIATNYQYKEQIKCEENGGVVLKHFMGHQCLTKKDIEKLKGDK